MKHDRTFEHPVNISIQICSTKKNKINDAVMPYPNFPESSCIEIPRKPLKNTIHIMKKNKNQDVNLALLPAESNLPSWVTKYSSNKITT